MKKLIGLFVIQICIHALYAQEFVIPESAACDPVGNRYFISNYGDGNIIQIDSTGMKSIFKTGLTKPLGMIIHQNILYVVNGFKYVNGFQISDGSETFKVCIEEARFLNDITVDNSGFIYATDSNAGSVYKIEISAQTAQLFLATEQGSNGICYDPFNNRLVVCYFKENAFVDEISLPAARQNRITDSSFYNLDGIAMDESGNFYISCWGRGSFAAGFNENGFLIKFDNRFEKDPVIYQTGHRSPADIFYNQAKKEMVLPLFLENEVLFQSIRDYEKKSENK